MKYSSTPSYKDVFRQGKANWVPLYTKLVKKHKFTLSGHWEDASLQVKDIWTYPKS